MVFWLLVLHAAFMIMSGTIKMPFAITGKKHLCAACWGKLIAHMAAFASIMAGGTLQQTAFFSSRPWWAAALVPVHLAALMGILFLLQLVGRLMRKVASTDV